jgi:probable F420-dependent oxidoreductase
MRFGVLVPHFTQFASVKGILDGARRAEELGFDSVWVRDHLFISAHHTEHAGITDTRFVTEATSTLAALIGVTDKITLGTAVLTPHRHPLKVAQIFATLSYLSQGRVIMGVGAGYDEHEFAALGIPFADRVEAIKETVEICRLCWRQDDVCFSGRLFSFQHVTLDPKPVGGSVPIWYGGVTMKSVERAVDFADGWFPSRVPFAKLAARIERCRELRRQFGRKGPFEIAAIPHTVVGATADAALAKIDVPKTMLDARRYKMIPEKEQSSIEDLAGSLIWGNADGLCRFVERFANVGVNHVVFDLRSAFEGFSQCIRVLGEGVLRKFR